MSSKEFTKHEPLPNEVDLSAPAIQHVLGRLDKMDARIDNLLKIIEHNSSDTEQQPFGAAAGPMHSSAMGGLNQAEPTDTISIQRRYRTYNDNCITLNEFIDRCDKYFPFIIDLFDADDRPINNLTDELMGNIAKGMYYFRTAAEAAEMVLFDNEGDIGFSFFLHSPPTVKRTLMLPAVDEFILVGDESIYDTSLLRNIEDKLDNNLRKLKERLAAKKDKKAELLEGEKYREKLLTSKVY